MSDNSWYENGELPPEGIECEVFTNQLWVKCRIKTHMTECGQVIAFYQMSNRWGFDSDSSKFRPIKTERELAIEAAMESICHLVGSAILRNDIACSLFEDGLLRPKNES